MRRKRRRRGVVTHRDGRRGMLSINDDGDGDAE